MKSSRKRKVTAAFFAAAALGGVAHAAPTLNMNDLVGSNTLPLNQRLKPL